MPQNKQVQIDEQLFIKIFTYFMKKEMNEGLFLEEREIYEALENKAERIIARQEYRKRYVNDNSIVNDAVQILNKEETTNGENQNN